MPPGLNPDTIPRYLVGRSAQADPSLIRAYHVDGEALTQFQEGWTSWLPGNYKAPGEHITLAAAHPRLKPEDLHAMTEVIASMEKQKEADQKTLTDALGRTPAPSTLPPPVLGPLP